MLLQLKRNKLPGFTLLEVLVALIFFSLIGLVIQQVSASTVSQYQAVRLKMLGTWVAENKLTEIRLSNASLAAREYKEELSYGGLEWELISNVVATEDPRFKKIELAAYSLGDSLDDRRRRASLTSFVGSR
jgi:general secretion pathway protein I